MAWITSNEMLDKGMLPLDVYDANGILIKRAISGCDPVTGEIESHCISPDGSFIVDEDKGMTVRRRETFAAPLLLKKLTEEQLARRKTEKFWDQEDLEKMKEQ